MATVPPCRWGPASLPKAGNAIIGTQEGGRDASTRDRALCRLGVSQCPPWITRQDVHSRLKNAKSQRNKRSLICSEGEPTLLSIHTDKDVEIAAPLLTRKGAEKRLIARRRAEQVQTGYTWTTDGVYLGNMRKSRRELRQRDKYGHLQAAQSSKAGRKKRK